MDYIHTRFAKLSVRVIYAGEIRNYREENSTLEIFSQGCNVHTVSLCWLNMNTWAREMEGYVWFYE